MNRTILHSDLNNFYASVECLYNPSLRDKPVAVAGDPDSRHGIILAKNNVAKRYGVKTGEALWQAREKCRSIVFVPPHYELYLRFSKEVKEIYSEYTDLVEPFGMDECWLDVSSGGQRVNGKSIADELRRRIKSELGLTVSVGVSYNKIFAKLGSDLKKPDAVTVIDKEHFREKIWPLPVGELLYAGPATCRKLSRYGIRTIGALAETNPGILRKTLGKNGIMLWSFANGMDMSPVAKYQSEREIKSIGNGTTAPRDLVNDDDIQITLRILCESVSKRLREHGLLCRTVQLSIKDTGLHTIERQAKLDIPNRTSKDIFEKAFRLYKQNSSGDPVRALSVRACDLISEDTEQLSFFPEAKALQRQESLESALCSLRSRFGKKCISSGSLLKDSQLSGISSKPANLVSGEVFSHNFERRV